MNDQEDQSSKPVWAISFRDPILKKKTITTRKADRVAQGVGSEFKPQYPPPKKKQEYENL
jgi:hypothetical protein